MTADETVTLIGYVILKRRTGSNTTELDVQRIYDTDDGPVFGDDRKDTIEVHRLAASVVDIVPLSDTKTVPAPDEAEEAVNQQEADR